MTAVQATASSLFPPRDACLQIGILRGGGEMFRFRSSSLPVKSAFLQDQGDEPARRCVCMSPVLPSSDYDSDSWRGGDLEDEDVGG